MRSAKPTQFYAAVAGVFLLVLGILSLVIEGPGFGTVGNVAADTTNNITHAILAALGLLVGLMPWPVPAAPADAAEERVEAGRRFSRRPAEASARRPGQAA